VTLEEARERIFSPRVYPFFSLAVVLVVVAAFLQFGGTTNLRWIKLILGLIVVAALVVSRLSIGIGVFLIVSLFPANIVLGPTNFVLAVLLFVAWMGKAALGRAPGISRTPCDVPLGLLTLAYVISWVNVTRDPFHIQQAWWYTQNQLGALIVFYMTYAALQKTSDAKILMTFLQLMAFIIYATAVLEVATGVSITGLGKIGEAQYRLGGAVVRAGGLLGSHDMLADFCSINMPAHVYFLFRSRRGIDRLAFGTLTLLGIVVLFMTSNRGGLVGFFAGVAYFLFLVRNQVAVGLFVTLIAAFTVLFATTNALLSKAGRTLSVFYRFANTRFYGILPETRVGVFDHFQYRIAAHPILGEGPYYRLRLPERDVMVFWPHNAFGYYWVTVGLLGMLSFLVLIGQVLVHTWRMRPKVLGKDLVRDFVLLAHIMVAVLVVTQQRTDFQRGFVFTYYVFFLLGFAMGMWNLARKRASEPSGETEG